MKKQRLVLMLLLVSLCMSVSVFAAAKDISIKPTLSFSGTTATCMVIINESEKQIHATMRLWNGNTLVDSWSDSATSRLILSDTITLVSGKNYTLTVSGTIDGVHFTGTPVSKTCP